MGLRANVLEDYYYEIDDLTMRMQVLEDLLERN